jgi:hypothetical protein
LALKRFVKERSERTGLIDELRDALVSGSSSSVKSVGNSGVGVYLRFFLRPRKFSLQVWGHGCL